MCLSGLVLPQAAAGQTAGQLTEGSYAPPSQRLTGSVEFSGAPGLAAPEGSDRLSIHLSGVAVEGEIPGSAAAVARLRQRLTGGRIAVSEIFAAAGELEASLAASGLVLSRVVIPAQTLLDGGTLRLTMVDGFVEAIDAAGVPEHLRQRLARLTDPLIGRTGLTLAEIERRLLLAGDTYGVAMGSALATGQRPGGTVIVLNPQFKRVTGFAGMDNTMSKGLGRVNFSSGLELNGFLGVGEVVYLRASGSPRFGSDGYFSKRPPVRTLAGGVVLPIGGNGLTFGIELADSRTRNDGSGVATATSFRRQSFRLNYPLIRSTRTNLSFGLALDVQEDRQELLTIAGPIGLHFDRTRVLRFSTNMSHRLENHGLVSVSAIYSQGLSGLGARSRRDATVALPLSRGGADADFNKFELSAAWQKSFAETWGILVQGRAQTSFGRPLLSGEQFGVASTDAVSPLSQGSMSGDAGWVLRAELSRSFQSGIADFPVFITPYSFGAVGEVFKVNALAGEHSRQGATAYGVGLELTLIRDPRYSSASLRAEYGQAQLSHGGGNNERLTLVGSFRF